MPGWTIFGGYTYLDPIVTDGGNSALTAAAVGTQAAQVVYVTSVNTGKQVPSTVRNSFTATTNVTLYKRFQIGGSVIYNDRQYGGYADNRTATQTAAGCGDGEPGDGGAVPRNTRLYGASTRGRATT